MFFKSRARVFDPDALPDLRRCADTLLERARSNRTSLGHHAAMASGREHICAVANRFYGSILPDMFADRFGTPPALNLGFTTIRRQAPETPEMLVEWHIDLNFARDDAPFLVAWVPLEDVGETRIGLEVCVPTRPVPAKAALLPWTRRAATGDSLVFGDEEVDAIFGADGYQVRALRMSAGDAAIFDQFTLHRTQHLPQATEARRSFEFRMVDLDALPILSRQTAGIFCRRNPDVEGGIEYLFKGETGPAAPIDPAELDELAAEPRG